MNNKRNPLVIPDSPAGGTRRGCPKCGVADFSGQMIYGVATFKCRTCQNEWQGGIGAVPADPREPAPPQDPRSAPTTDFERTKMSPNPEEYRVRRADPTPDFRRGAPIPKGDE